MAYEPRLLPPYEPFLLGVGVVFNILRCGFFAYSWKLPAYSGAFYLQLTVLAFFTYSWSSFLLTVLASSLTIRAFLLTVGKCA